MKKTILMGLFACMLILFTTVGHASSKKHFTKPKKTLKASKSKQRTIGYQCWNYTVSCGSGFVCANSLVEAMATVAAIEANYCNHSNACSGA
jgi:hypothetical protein